MAALENLAAAVDKLSTDVAALVAKANTPTGPSEADVQAQADRVTALDSTVVAALGTPAAPSS